MDRDSNPYRGLTVYFPTMHGKERIASALFRPLGISCRRVNIDTDQFGSFTGEIPRTASVRETLRAKLRAAALAEPQGRLFLASEGSFGPDPRIPYLKCDLESLLFWDRERNLEIYADYLCRAPVHAEISVGPKDHYEDFLRQIRFPKHSLVVRPASGSSRIHKGLKTLHEVESAMLDAFWNSDTGQVILGVDLRANHNRTRRRAIWNAAEALIGKILSPCPQCHAPGFSVISAYPGLPCDECGRPSAVTATVVWGCTNCRHEDVRSRPDGRTHIDPGECDACNP